MTTGTADDLVTLLSGRRRDLDRASTAERVADVLRGHVIDGLIAPGTRLSEDALVRALGVSRNTLREAFRLLSHEHLVAHELHRGVFVRRLTADDVVDLYRVRRILEGAGVRACAGAPEAARAATLEAVVAGEQAAAQDRWSDVGTANMRFHEALAALAGSPRVDELMRALLAELRLVFHVMDEPRPFHEPYLAGNRAIAELVVAGRAADADRALAEYLGLAEQQLLEAFAARR